MFNVAQPCFRKSRKIKIQVLAATKSLARSSPTDARCLQSDAVLSVGRAGSALLLPAKGPPTRTHHPSSRVGPAWAGTTELVSAGRFLKPGPGLCPNQPDLQVLRVQPGAGVPGRLRSRRMHEDALLGAENAPSPAGGNQGEPRLKMTTKAQHENACVRVLGLPGQITTN